MTAQSPISTVFGPGEVAAPRGVSLVQDTGVTGYVQSLLVTDTGNNRVLPSLRSSSPLDLLNPSDELFQDVYRGNPVISDTGHNRLVGLSFYFNDPVTIAGTGVAG